MRIHVSKEAEQDLDEIFVYWARRAGLEVADRLVDAIQGRRWVVSATRLHPAS
jgi:plasmid stabilization system protein ParE